MTLSGGPSNGLQVKTSVYETEVCWFDPSLRHLRGCSETGSRHSRTVQLRVRLPPGPPKPGSVAPRLVARVYEIGDMLPWSLKTKSANLDLAEGGPARFGRVAR